MMCPNPYTRFADTPHEYEEPGTSILEPFRRVKKKKLCGVEDTKALGNPWPASRGLALHLSLSVLTRDTFLLEAAQHP
jgi:hypothetical protein